MSRELFGKLARLRRETLHADAPQPSGPDAAAPERAGPASELPAWFRRRAAPVELAAEAGSSACTLGAPGELAEHTNARGTFAARLRAYPLAHTHGRLALGEALTARADELAWLTREPALAALDPARAVYLDIETTGLSGGAGTIPFLVALGRFEQGEFRLWQAFLRHPGEEAAALEEVAARVRAASGVVSFFGKSFDRHRLEDKMRLHRIAPPFDACPHLDLYHPLRRFYGAAWLDTRLATVERELAGVAREDDLPGSLAPAAWYDFLAGRPHRLEAVFRHNELDVLSLVVLAGHLAATRTGRAGGLSGPARPRARALAELFAERREFDSALGALELALSLPGGDDGELRFRRAEVLRRLGREGEALGAHLELARGRRDALAPRAWLAAARLALRRGERALLDEALSAGTRALEYSATVRQREDSQAELERLRRRAERG